MTEYNNKAGIDYYKSFDWTFQTWKPTPALIDKNGFPSHQYVGQKFDSNYFTIDSHGWTHDHCEVCWKTLCENNEECETSGFVSGNKWLCISCYNSFIKES
jgi:hypothetical protein